MAADEDIGELLLESVVVPVELPQELEDGDLKERVLHASDLVLALQLEGDLPVRPLYFREQLDDLRDVGLVDTDGVLEEGSTAEQYSVALLLEAGGYLGQELRDVDGHSLDDFDCCEDGFLADVGRVAADALGEETSTLSTSWCRSRANSAVQISERTQRARLTILLLLPLRSMRILLVAIMSSSDFSWKSWVSPGWSLLYRGSRCAFR